MKNFDWQAEVGKDVSLVRVEIAEMTLSILRRIFGAEYVKGPMKPGKHDFVILTVIDRNYKELSFVAEKVRNGSSGVGTPTHIRIVRRSEHSSATLPFRSRFVWKLHGQNVSSAELNIILTNDVDYDWASNNCWKYATLTDVDYDWASNNCWKYATLIVEKMLCLCLFHSLRIRNFKGVECRLEGLWQLEMVKRALPLDVCHSFVKPLSRKNRGTWRRIKNWFCCCSVESSCAGNCDTDCDTDCDTVQEVLRLCLKHWHRMKELQLAEACDTIEDVLERCSRRSQRTHDVELEQGCEEALQQLEDVKEPSIGDHVRLVFDPTSRKNRVFLPFSRKTRRTFRRVRNSLAGLFSQFGVILRQKL